MSTPRRIPTEEIEVGRWHRFEDSVPAEPLDALVMNDSEMVSVESIGPEDSLVDHAWMLPHLPDSLPPREEKPKRFVVGCDHEVVDTHANGGQVPYAVCVGRCAEEWCALLNVGHEALEGGERS